ncbi:hypothetical protein IG631_05117 [Alternaria alternata]|nr:hypothetical protein IG631_05117 [Alternaria alternata]
MLDVSNISTLLCSVFSLCLLATHGVMNLRRGMCTAERSACSVIRMSRINGVWEHLKACRLGDLSDIHEAQSETQTMISLAISNKNAVIIGPADTPFEDGTFRLIMHFEEAYPNKPPGVKFISQMFHPNVYGTGELCLDILQNRWSPTYDVAAILTSIQRYVRGGRRLDCEHGAGHVLTSAVC